MNGIELLIAVFVKLTPVILAVAVPLTICLVLEHRDRLRHAELGLLPSLECDTCGDVYQHDAANADSFQTYNGQWFCSDSCGRKAGW